MEHETLVLLLEEASVAEGYETDVVYWRVFGKIFERDSESVYIARDSELSVARERGLG